MSSLLEESDSGGGAFLRVALGLATGLTFGGGGASALAFGGRPLSWKLALAFQALEYFV